MRIGAAALLAVTAPCQTTAAEPDLASALRERIVAHLPSGALPVQQNLVRTFATLTQAYEDRAFTPFWFSQTTLSPAAGELIAALSRAAEHGIAPARYRLQEIRALADVADTAAIGALVDLELLLTDAFLLHAADLVAGRVDPTSLDPLWVAQRRARNLPQLLEQASQQAPGAVLEGLAPPHPQYVALRAALRRLTATPAPVEPWAPVAEGVKLELGSSGERVEQLNRALTQLGYRDAAPDVTQFNEATRDAVVRFQRDNGLEADGVAGRKTLSVLNLSEPGQRARRVALNLERWRWLPDDLGERHLEVNIAGYDLRLVAAGETELTMRVIVGREARRSPVMSERMTYLVLNPSWNVPHKIAVLDKLPQFRQNPALIAQQGYEIYRGWGAEAQRIDPATIDWTALSPAQFPYRLRQLPGPDNALGRIKFMFPNKFAVYLHDTPGRELFSRDERSFSSGCIRIEQPLALALALLRDDPVWSPQALETALAQGTERVVKLPRPIPVHLLYWTAWVDGAGKLHFRRDLYGRDARLSDALYAADAP